MKRPLSYGSVFQTKSNVAAMETNAITASFFPKKIKKEKINVENNFTKNNHFQGSQHFISRMEQNTGLGHNNKPFLKTYKCSSL